MQVIADHLRAATAMIKEDLEPSNKQQGYILRRLIRRSAVKFRQLAGKLKPDYFSKITNQPIIINEINKFQQSLNKGLVLIDKTDLTKIDAQFAFNLFQTHGFPLEITQEILADKGLVLNQKDFYKQKKAHQQKSRSASAGMFKGGLADESEATVKLHTATHLLHAALRKILGTHIKQEGSHITAKRLRFDFIHPQPLTRQELKQIEILVNHQIKKNLPVIKTIENKQTALQNGALAFFDKTYPDKVTVYSIGSFSRELCHGPHVASTGEIGGVRIIKQQSIGVSKRRLYAVLANGIKKPTHQA